jgi:hypothetical protein
MNIAIRSLGKTRRNITRKTIFESLTTTTERMFGLKRTLMEKWRVLFNCFCIYSFSLHKLQVAQDIPTAESLKLTSRAYTLENDPPLPQGITSKSRIERDEWMLPPTADAAELPFDKASSTAGASGGSKDAAQERGEDFFSSLGIEKKKKQAPERPDPDDVRIYANFVCSSKLYCLYSRLS